MGMNIDQLVELVTKNTEEVVTRDKLTELLKNKTRELTAYIGFEPSGKVHLGWLIIANKIAELNQCGFHVTLYLADWHAYINDKFGADMDKIRKCGKYMEKCFEALGVDPEKNSFRYASELIKKESYWKRVFQVAKKTSLSRTKRAMSIMGRKGGESETDTSKFFYPPMQVADIFELDVDLALGGLDQRRAHMLALDVADKMKWKKPIALHTPILSGLDSGGRMDMVEGKMSKSKADSCIFIHDSAKSIKKKFQKAYCCQGEVEGNPIVDILKYIIFPEEGEFHISRPEKWGGDMHFTSFEHLSRVFQEEELHPMDMKTGAAEALARILKPAQEKLVNEYGSLESIDRMEFLN